MSLSKSARFFMLAALLGGLSGCGSAVTLRLPEQFRDKKLIEDPPPTSRLPQKDRALELACLPSRT